MAILSKHHGKVLEIRLAREAVLNALDLEHLLALEACLEAAAEDYSIRAILLCADGRAFCVGGDIKAMDKMSDAEFARCTGLYQNLCRKTRALDKPIVAAINGHALGGGLELALMADLRIAGRSARFGVPDAELGFSPSGGLSYQLHRIIGAGRAMHLALSCEILDAQQALAIGLITRVVEDDELQDAAIQLAQQIAAYPPTGIRNIKRVLNAGQELNLEAALTLEAQLDIECYHSAETRAALKAFIEARKK